MNAETINNVMAPTVHLNGTSGEALRREVTAVIDPLRQAVEAIKEMTIHGRDYYIQNDSANNLQIAEEQARERFRKLNEVLDELIVYRYKIKSQIKK